MSGRKERLRRKVNGVRMKELRVAETGRREQEATEQKQVDEQVEKWSPGHVDDIDPNDPCYGADPS